MEVESFLNDINPLIEELRMQEKSGNNTQNLEEEIRSKTQEFIQEYEMSYTNKIEEVKRKMAIEQDTEKMSLLKKELEDFEKELDSFKEIMGDIDFSNSKYTYFLQTLIGRMEEKTMSRMSDGIIYDHGNKIKDMNNFTVEDALNIDSKEIENTQFDKEQVNLETLKTIFNKIECGFEDCLSPLYIKLKEKIFEDNKYEEAINSLQGLKIEDIYEKIVKHVQKFSSNSPVRKKEEDMFEAVKTRRSELEKVNAEESNNIEQDKSSTDIQVQNANQTNYLSVNVKKELNIFENIKQIGKKVKNWFTTRKKQNDESKSPVNISKKEEKNNFFNNIKKGVPQIKTPNQSSEKRITPIEKEILE